MKIGLIDVDGHNFPNLPLMKISALHKKMGDSVEWYEPLISDHMDIVLISKVFTFTSDYQYYIDADEIIKGGTGYDLTTKLHEETEHIYPDYSLYPNLTKNTAYGFLTRGCPRNCEFCIVSKKEGCKSYKVADLSEFWRGQKEIKLLDPNLLATTGHKELLQQLIDSKAWIDITQGLDARLLTEENIELIKQLKLKMIHFAWDNIKDEHLIIPKLKIFKKLTGVDKRKASVYVLINFNSTFEEDLHRVYTIRDIGMSPYVMIYDKANAPQNVKDLQRWVNNRYIWYASDTAKFEDYKKTS